MGFYPIKFLGEIMRKFQKCMKKLLSFMLVASLIFGVPTFNNFNYIFANSVGTKSSLKKVTELDNKNSEEDDIEIDYENELSTDSYEEEKEFDDDINNDVKNSENDVSEETKENAENDDKTDGIIENDDNILNDKVTDDTVENDKTIENVDKKVINELDNDTNTAGEDKDEENNLGKDVSNDVIKITDLDDEDSKNNEIKFVSTNSVVTKEDEDNNIEIEVESDIDEIDYDIVATDSDVKIATDSVVKIDYKKLNTYEQIIYQDEDAATIDGNVIKIEKDIELTQALYFTGDMNLDLNGHNITGPRDDYAISVKNDWILTNSSENNGKIIGRANGFPTILIEGGNVELAGGFIYGANASDLIYEEENKALNGGDAIHSRNSTLSFCGVVVSGGNGEEQKDNKGGNGGSAVVILDAKPSDKISITSGSISGGNGAKGTGDMMPSIGAALRVNGKIYESQYFGKGLKGAAGGGNGGVALDIRTEKFKSKNLYYKDYSLNAGAAGYSNSTSSNNEILRGNINNIDDEEIFGATARSSYYSLHDLDGINYLTSLKSQGATGLCVSFAATAYAETSLIKNYPDFVKNTLGKNVSDTLDRNSWKTNSNELNLSELQFGMQMYVQPKDEFGNAGLSKYAHDVNSEQDWAYLGADLSMVAKTATTWRTLVEEDDELRWPSANGTDLVLHRIDRNFLNNYTNKTVVHAKNAIMHSAEDFCNGVEFDRERFITQLKKDIVNYSGVVLSIYTGNRQQFATFANGTNAYVSNNGVNYGNYVMGLGISSAVKKTETSDLGAHTMYCVGWDNKVEFADSLGTHIGAFICKNSWGQFSLVPFDTAWALYYKEDADDGNSHIPNYFMDYVAIEFVPAFSEYENIYFYDSGIGKEIISQSDSEGVFVDSVVKTNVENYGEVTYKLNLNYSSIVNTFEIRNDREKVKGVEAFISEDGEYKVTIYKVATLENETTLLNNMKESNAKTSEKVFLSKGMNFIPLSNEVDFDKDDKIAVKIERLDKNNFGRVEIDSIVDGTYVENSVLKGTKYETQHKGRSFFTDLSLKIFEAETGDGSYSEGDSEFSSMMENGGNAIIDTAKNSANNKIRKFQDGKNARIRLITNNYIKLYANEKGKFENNLTETYAYPKLREAIGNIVEPSPIGTDDVFEKYNTKSDGTGIDFGTANIYNLEVGKSLSLYAQWINAADFATLTFDANGGEGTMTAMTRARNTDIVIPTASFKKYGYVFVGWVDDNGSEFDAGDNLTIDSDITLTAKWEENEFKVAYELNDGNFKLGFTDYPKKRLFTEDVTLPTADKVERVGYIFDGWYDNEDFENASYTVTNAKNTEKEYTFYAKWKPVTYTIEYDTNGGTISEKSFVKVYDTDAKGLLTPKKYLDKFLGWYEDPKLTIPYENKDLSTIDNDKKCIYAKWEHVKITILKFDTKYGKIPVEQYIEDNKKATEPNIENVTGYKLSYWYESDEDVKFDFNETLSAEDEKTITLHAKWEALTYKVTLEVGNGTINDGNITEYKYGVGATLPTNITPKESNEEFDGWYETNDFSGNKVTSISKSDIGDKVFYAHYIVKENDNNDSSAETGNRGKNESYSRSPSGVGGSSGSGGSGGSGGGAGIYTGDQLNANATPLTQDKSKEARDTTIDADMKTIPVHYNTGDSVWTSDDEGYRHLNLKDGAGDMVEAKNLFACIITPHTDAKGEKFEVEDFYYFDNDGKMYIGWLKDIDRTTYYFESEVAEEFGKLARGWTKIKGDHYYFDGSGTLQTNTTTPDGFIVDENGKWVENNVNPSSNTESEKKQKVETVKNPVGIVLN